MNNRWTIDTEGKMKGYSIDLLTPHELAVLRERAPDTVLYSISGDKMKASDQIDDDTRFGYLAVGTLSPGQEPVPDEG